jgi:Tol biopolymer transport system component
MNLDGSGLERVYQDQYSLAYPAWSPDGEKLAFVNLELIYGPRAIFIGDLTTGDLGAVGIPIEGRDHPGGILSWVE